MSPMMPQETQIEPSKPTSETKADSKSHAGRANGRTEITFEINVQKGVSGQLQARGAGGHVPHTVVGRTVDNKLIYYLQFHGR